MDTLWTKTFLGYSKLILKGDGTATDESELLQFSLYFVYINPF